MSHPSDPKARQELRDRRLQDGRAKGEIEARQLFSSMKCSDFAGTGHYRHAGDPDGCRNDGSGCLCECHDLTQFTQIE